MESGPFLEVVALDVVPAVGGSRNSLTWIKSTIEEPGSVWKHSSQGKAASEGGKEPDQEKSMKTLTVVGAALGAAMLCLSPVSLHLSPAGTVVISVDKADARVGRPLTPGSVAGVNRRVHRRAYYGAAVGAAAVGAAATGAYYHGRRCGYYPYPPC